MSNTTPNTDTYVLAHGNMGYFGNSYYWWAQKGGYTPYLDKAQQFSLEEAEQHQRGTKRSHNFMIYNYQKLMSKSHIIVDRQDLKDDEIVTSTKA